MQLVRPLAQKLSLSRSEQAEVTFNVSELLADVSVLMTAKPSTDDLVLLLSQMEHHWPYHQEQLKKLAARISTTERVGKARKRR